MEDRENVEEWTDDDRENELAKIRKGMAEVYTNKGDAQIAAGRLFVDYRIMLEALSECARRYLDATGRGRYSNSTLENEIAFFTRLGESQVIYSSRPR